MSVSWTKKVCNMSVTCISASLRSYYLETRIYQRSSCSCLPVRTMSTNMSTAKSFTKLHAVALACAYMKLCMKHAQRCNAVLLCECDSCLQCCRCMGFGACFECAIRLQSGHNSVAETQRKSAMRACLFAGLGVAVCLHDMVRCMWEIGSI